LFVTQGGLSDDRNDGARDLEMNQTPACIAPGCKTILCTCVLLLVTLQQDVVAQQGFPVKPVRILTGTAGGSSDIAARLIAQALGALFGQQVIVDARPNVLAREIVIKSPADGYNLLLTVETVGSSPEQLAAAMKSEMTRMAKVIKDAGIREE